MSNLSVTVLSSSGRKLGYKTYKQAKADLDEGRASRESERCIRLLPSVEAVEWRSRQSGKYGPIVRQVAKPTTGREHP